MPSLYAKARSWADARLASDDRADYIAFILSRYQGRDEGTRNRTEEGGCNQQGGRQVDQVSMMKRSLEGTFGEGDQDMRCLWS